MYANNSISMYNLCQLKWGKNQELKRVTVLEKAYHLALIITYLPQLPCLFHLLNHLAVYIPCFPSTLPSHLPQ